MNAPNTLSGMVACFWLLEEKTHELVACVTDLSSGLFPIPPGDH